MEGVFSLHASSVLGSHPPCRCVCGRDQRRCSNGGDQLLMRPVSRVLSHGCTVTYRTGAQRRRRGGLFSGRVAHGADSIGPSVKQPRHCRRPWACPGCLWCPSCWEHLASSVQSGQRPGSLGCTGIRARGVGPQGILPRATSSLLQKQLVPLAQSASS